MTNYYKLLDLSPISSTEQIKLAIKDKRRLWMQKTNAPQLERRQEAEVKVKQIDEAEQTLLNDGKKNEYDNQLKNSTVQDERTIDASQFNNESLIEQGWDLLINDSIADAIYVATKATEVDGSNAEAWALLAQAKFRWKEYDDSIYEYRKAIKLKPNESVYYFELGSVYESIQKWQEAVDNYLKASQINPNIVMYRAAIGQVYLRLEIFNEAIPILERCHEEEPDNETYNWFLALAYNDFVVHNHMKTSVDGRFIIDNKESAESCVEYFEKALELNFTDPEMEKLINTNLDYAKWCLSKSWGRPIGKTFIWGAILLLLTLVVLNGGNGTHIFIMLIIDAVWIYFGFKPGFKINKNYLNYTT